MTHKGKILDFSKIKTYPLRERENKVKREDFALAQKRDGKFGDFLSGLPKILAANDFRSIVQAIINARKQQKPVIFAIGGHVIKCGVGPILIDLMQRGIVTHLAMNGSAAVHDFEIAMIGQTSEDVASSLRDGTFGMAEETGRLMNNALRSGVKQGLGAGQAFGEMILKGDFRFKELSVLSRAIECGVSATVHVAIGTDIIHQHPAADGAVIGEATFKDFQLFCGSVSQMGAGGVFCNVGSAVVMPEVFLKALSISRNLGYPLKGFVTANFDMIYQYRQRENVVRRPHGDDAKGYVIIGHHEIMLPLLARAVIDKLDS
ncbi:MAG TPA: hypothetical protein P5287_06005 [bacterium]|nr:hypothetical protein [bacterium]